MMDVPFSWRVGRAPGPAGAAGDARLPGLAARSGLAAGAPKAGLAAFGPV